MKIIASILIGIIGGILGFFIARESGLIIGFSLGFIISEIIRRKK